MRAVTYQEFGGPISVSDVPEPEPGPDEVVVEVKASGVCRSDWHGWQGHDPDITRLPHVPGHELAGVIHSLGEDVTGWEVGERVTVPFIAGCGRCKVCRDGNPQVCPDQSQPGFNYWGSFAELVTIRHAQHNLVRIPKALDFTETAVLGCRFSTAYRAVVEQGALGNGDSVIIHGCGGVGLSAVMIAAALGAKVYAVDPNESALEKAVEFGATETLTPGPGLAASLIELTEGGANLAIDAIGNSDVISTSLDSLRAGGRHIQVGLLAGRKTSLGLDRLISKELEVVGSHGIAAASFPAMFELIQAKNLDIRTLVSRELTLDEGANTLQTFAERTEAGVAVITEF